MFGRRIELPQVLRRLHPANDVQPRLPVGTLIRHDCVRVTAAAMNAHEFPAWRNNQPGCCIDLSLAFLGDARYREQRGNAERGEAAL